MNSLYIYLSGIDWRDAFKQYHPKAWVKEERGMTLLTYLTCLAVGISIASSAAANKIVDLPWGFDACATVFTFVIMSEILTFISVVYGPDRAGALNQPIFWTSVVAVIIFTLCIAAPANSAWLSQPGKGIDAQTAYSFTLGSTWRLVLAGKIAFFVYLEVKVRLSKWLKRLLNNRLPLIWSGVATQVALAIDTVLFVGIAFGDSPNLFGIMLGQHIVKCLFTLALTPILYSLIVRCMRKENDYDPPSSPHAFPNSTIGLSPA